MRYPFRVVLTAVALASPTAEAAAIRPPPRLAQMTPPGEASRPLSGNEAWMAMLGNTITGTTPDGDYTEFFNPDGTIVHIDRDGRLVGHWSVKDQLVCFSYPDEDEVECRKPQLDGQQGAFIDTDGARYTFQLEPGNPKGL